MLPGIGDFLKSTFGESLTKPLQPAGLFAAGIMVLLNALFIYPVLIDQGHPLAVALRDLGGIAQVVLATALVVTLAYVLLSLGGAILKLMTGEIWGRSPMIGAALREYQQGQYMKLKRQIWDSSHDSPERRLARRQLLFQMVTNFPANKELVVPTSLGNVMQATVGYLWDHYRIDMAALWPHMETVIASKEALSNRIDNEKATLDFLLNLSLVLYVFAFEHVVVRFALRQWPETVWSLVFVAAGWAVYRAAVGKGRAWSSAVQQAFDMYRDELRQALRVRPFRDFADELAAWQRISRWLLWGEPPGDLLAFGSGDGADSSTSPSPLHVATSANVTASVQAQSVIVENTPATCAAAQVEWLQKIEYLLFVASNSGSQPHHAPTEGIYVLATDTRVPRLAAAAVNAPLSWTVEVVPTGKDQPKNSLLWTRARLPSSGATSLRYTLPIARARARTENDALRICAPLTATPYSGCIVLEYSLRLENTSGAVVAVDVPVRVFDSRGDGTAVPTPALLSRWRDGDAAGTRPRVSRLAHVDCLDGGESGWTWTIPREIWRDEHLRLRFQLKLTNQPRASARLMGILSGLKICAGVPPDGAGANVADAIQRGDVDRRCWTKMQLDDLIDAAPGVDGADARAAARNNLGCVLMQLYCWNEAEASLRSALVSSIPNWTPVGSTVSAKEAADWNLDQLRQARAAWGLGTLS